MPRTTPADRRRHAIAQPEASARDAEAIERFLERLWAEAGLARQTLDSYRRDLDGLARWLGERGSSLEAADRAALFDYFAVRTQQDYAPRSNARLLSAIRAFYSQLARLGSIAVDPAALLEAPKIGRSLPKALSESQVEALIAAPDINEPAGLRDRAMIELMYATGLRVSELVSLPAAGLPERIMIIFYTHECNYNKQTTGY